MIHEDMTDFAASLPRFGALAGLDLGTKTIGVAVSDGMRGVASPITTIRRTKFTQDAQALLTLIADRNLCLGCHRTLAEIAAWGRMTPDARARVMAVLPARQDASDMPRRGS